MKPVAALLGFGIGEHSFQGGLFFLRWELLHFHAL